MEWGTRSDIWKGRWTRHWVKVVLAGWSARQHGLGEERSPQGLVRGDGQHDALCQTWQGVQYVLQCDGKPLGRRLGRSGESLCLSHLDCGGNVDGGFRTLYLKSRVPGIETLTLGAHRGSWSDEEIFSTVARELQMPGGPEMQCEPPGLETLGLCVRLLPPRGTQTPRPSQ